MALRLRGRQIQIETLRRQHAVRAGRGGIVLVTGMAGMGKRALLAEDASMAVERSPSR